MADDDIGKDVCAMCGCLRSAHHRVADHDNSELNGPVLICPTATFTLRSGDQKR